MPSDFIQVLLIEDDIDYARLLKLRLSLIDSARFYPDSSPNQPIKLTHVVVFRQAMELLAERSFHLILLDLALPDSDGLDSLTLLAEQYPSVPVVVITGAYDDELASRALQIGAQDYLLKEKISGEVLDRSVRYAIERRRLLNALEAKHAAELEASEQSLRNLILHMADGIVVVDREGVVQYANPAYLSLMECSSGDVIGQKSPLELDQSDTTEFNFVRSNGVMHTCEIRTVPIYWEGAAANLASVRDVTLQRRATVALQQYADELEKHNENLGAFSHMVAHNLKHPLAHILLIVNSLRELSQEDLNPEIVQFLQNIEEFGDKMSFMIDELLLFAQIRDQEELIMTPMAMGDVLDQVLKRLAPSIAQSGAQVVIPPEWPLVLGYAAWVEEIWVNYLDNAIKYGGSPPHIELGYEEYENQMIRFWVRDNGPGIPAEQQPLLFKPFTRLERSERISHAPGGSGLGLAIARQIAEKLGGEVGFHSQKERGSVFSFTLPAHAEKANDTEAEAD